MANAIKRALQEHQVVLREDREHVPYGLRQPQEILGFVAPIFQEMIDEGCAVIVVACNTVSTTLIGRLREQCTVPLVALDPMVKPAAQRTKTGIIAVCATPTTLASPRYAQLKHEFATGLTVLEPDCSDWAAMIEQQAITQTAIDTRIQEVLQQGADVIVLACTHYHWIETEIKTLAAGLAEVLQPEQAVIAQLTRVLAQLA